MTIEEAKRKVSESPEYEFLRDMQKERQFVMLCIAGSYGYGTQTESSDIDVRGIFLHNMDELLLEQGKEQTTDEKPVVQPEEENDPAKETMIELETLEERAANGIREYLKSKNPYEFQDLVASLLKAMGYYIQSVAPRGKDGGIDIVAYTDPLGAKTPRIKVQVKHKPDTATGAADVRALLGILKAGDIALFVTSGTYSTDAKHAASSGDKFIRLIDGDEFIDMWQEYYDKMSDDDKNMLPLKRISFLGSND